MLTYSYLRLMKVSESKFLRTVRINSDAKLCDLLESLDTVMMSIVLHRQRQHAPVMIIHFMFLKPHQILTRVVTRTPLLS